MTSPPCVATFIIDDRSMQPPLWHSLIHELREAIVVLALRQMPILFAEHPRRGSGYVSTNAEPRLISAQPGNDAGQEERIAIVLQSLPSLPVNMDYNDTLSLLRRFAFTLIDNLCPKESVMSTQTSRTNRPSSVCPPANGRSPSSRFTPEAMAASAEDLIAFHDRFQDCFTRREQRVWWLTLVGGSLAIVVGALLLWGNLVTQVKT
jgi:hypothetical protein